MAPLANKKVVVIGASTGIGFAVAKASLAEGATVTVCSSNRAKLDAAVERLGGGDKVQSEVVDLSKEESIKALFERIGKFDHLVITAGDTKIPSAFPDMDLADSKHLLEVRYWGVLLCAKHSHKLVSESITITAGTTLERPWPGHGMVAGVGGALRSSTRGMAIDLAPVRVNCIAPGVVATDLFENIGMSQEARDGLYQRTKESTPLGFVAKADDIVEAYLFSMKCAFFTGQTVIVDGGATLV